MLFASLLNDRAADRIDISILLYILGKCNENIKYTEILNYL